MPPKLMPTGTRKKSPENQNQTLTQNQSQSLTQSHILNHNRKQKLFPPWILSNFQNRH